MPRMPQSQTEVKSRQAHEMDAIFGIISIHNMAIYGALCDVRQQICGSGRGHEHAM